MSEITVSEQALETWAGYLLEHSLGGIGTHDVVMLKGERVTWPLLQVLERRVVEAGAVPDVFLVPPNNDRGRVWSATMGRLGSPEQLARTPDWFTQRYEAMTKYIEVLGAESPASYSDLAADQLAAVAAADRPFADIRLSKPWVLTLYPTRAFAEMEGLSVEEYTDFIVRASTTDPRPLLKAEQELAPLFERAGQIVIETRHPEEDRDLQLRVDLTPGRASLSYGLKNFPDGEIFTSPDARSAEGEIFFDLPVHYGGHDIRGIWLKLEGGRITAYDAVEGRDRLEAIIETDDGSHRLGEVALGMNPGLDRVLKHPLFVEKVGGTLHVAIGASYEDCFVEDPASEAGRAKLEQLERDGILNRSAQHVDIVCDFRPGGAGRRVIVDGTELDPSGDVWTPVS